MKTDYKGAVIFADKEGNVRICYNKMVEMLQSDIIGTFGKTFKLSTTKDLILTINEGFNLSFIGLSNSNYKISSTYPIGEELSLLMDWDADFKSNFAYFVLSNGTILIFDMTNKKKTMYNVEQKCYMSLSPDDRKFTALKLNFNSKYLAVACITTQCKKKENIIYVYKVIIDQKRDIRLALAAQTCIENTWEGSKLGS